MIIRTVDTPRRVTLEELRGCLRPTNADRAEAMFDHYGQTEFGTGDVFEQFHKTWGNVSRATTTRVVDQLVRLGVVVLTTPDKRSDRTYQFDMASVPSEWIQKEEKNPLSLEEENQRLRKQIEMLEKRIQELLSTSS